MKNKKLAILLFVFALPFFIAGCKKEEKEPEKTVYDKLIGKWYVGNFYLQNNLVATADGSTLTFNACGTQPCSGTSYKASNSTSGPFTWKLANNDTEIIFSDSSSVGGYWNGTEQIVSLTDSKLVIKASTILGEAKTEFTK